jgi:hypothetical protein
MIQKLDASGGGRLSEQLTASRGANETNPPTDGKARHCLDPRAAHKRIVPLWPAAVAKYKYQDFRNSDFRAEN